MESSSHSKMVSQTLPKCHWDGFFTWIFWNLGRFILARKRRVRLEALFQKSQHLNSWISWIFKTYTYHQSYLCPSAILLLIPKEMKILSDSIIQVIFEGTALLKYETFR